MNAGAPAPAKTLRPSTPLTRDLIQQYLDENALLIEAVVDLQNKGALMEAARYQERALDNLMYLAAIADVQP
ncbi:SSXT protein (N-terminal region) [Plasmodiophora brassicae]